MRLKLINKPTQPAIDLNTIKSHLRITHSQEDELLKIYRKSAEAYVENYTGYQLREATYELSSDSFGLYSTITLPKAPVKEVVSITYVDEDGVDQVVNASDYILYEEDLFGRVTSNLEYPYWPATRRNTTNAVRIRFVCGWSSTQDIPGSFLDPLLMLITHQYIHRSAVGQNNFPVPYGVDHMLDLVRLMGV